MKKLLIIGGAVVVLLFACGLLAVIFGDTSPDTTEPSTSVVEVEPTDESVPTDEPAPTSAPTDEPAPTPVPTDEPVPTDPPADPVDALRATIDNALGESNRDLGRKLALFDVNEEERSVSISMPIDDHFSNDLIVAGVQLDTIEILKAIDASGIPYDWVFIGGTFAMQDKYGNAEEMNVLTLSYTQETVDKINWDNFQRSNIFDIANAFYLHPAFQN